MRDAPSLRCHALTGEERDLKHKHTHTHKQKPSLKVRVRWGQHIDRRTVPNWTLLHMSSSVFLVSLTHHFPFLPVSVLCHKISPRTCLLRSVAIVLRNLFYSFTAPNVIQTTPYVRIRLIFCYDIISDPFYPPFPAPCCVNVTTKCFVWCRTQVYGSHRDILCLVRAHKTLWIMS